MTAMFEIPLASETLTQEELAEITGSRRRLVQMDWLNENKWTYALSRAQIPVVGRLYARLRLAGLDPAGLVSGAGIAAQSAWTPDFAKLNEKH
jgi:hypothetical protein